MSFTKTPNESKNPTVLLENTVNLLLCAFQTHTRQEPMFASRNAELEESIYNALEFISDAFCKSTKNDGTVALIDVVTGADPETLKNTLNHLREQGVDSIPLDADTRKKLAYITATIG